MLCAARRGALALLLVVTTVGLRFGHAQDAAEGTTAPIDLLQEQSAPPQLSENAADSESSSQNLIFNPSVTVSEGYVDNIFATRNDRVGDFMTVVAPTIDLEMSGTDYRLDLSGGAELGFFESRTSEDYEDYFATADTWYRLEPDWGLFGGVGYFREHEDRSSPDDVSGLNPTEYDDYQAYVGSFNRFGQFSIRSGLTYDYWDFYNATGMIGTNDDRDRQVLDAGARIGYAVSPRFEIFGQGYFDLTDYDDRSDDNGYFRDSDGVRFAGGVGYQIGRELDVEALAGYIYQDFDDSRFSSISTFDIGADLTWRPMPGTTIRGAIDRTLEETTLAGSSSYISTGGYLAIDRAIRPDLILGASSSYFIDEYQDVGRTDRTFGFGANVKYYFVPNFFAGIDYSFSQRDSDFAAEDYDENRIFLSFGAELQPGYSDEEMALAAPLSDGSGPYGGFQFAVGNLGTELAGRRGMGTLTADFADHGLGYGAFAGYGAYFGDWYLGFELDGEASDAEWNHSRLPGGRVFSVNKEASYGLSALFGRRLTGGELIYGRFGGALAEMETQYSTANESVTDDETLTGFRFGVGAEVPIDGGLFARMDYSYTAYEDYDIRIGRGVDDNFANAESVLRAGFGYRFGGQPTALPPTGFDLDGPYIGIQAGMGALNSEVAGPRQEDPMGTPSTLNADFGDEGFSGGIFAGYGETFGSLYLGIEGEVDFSHTEPDLERDPSGRDFSVHKELSYGASIRAGVMLSPSAMLYGRAGPVWTDFQTNYSTSGGVFDRDATEFGWRFGGGLEFAATERVFVRTDYTFTLYDEYGVQYGAGDTDTFDNSESLFRIGIGYRF